MAVHVPFRFGERVQWRSHGHVADFCPICRVVERVEIRERREGVDLVVLSAIRIPLGGMAGTGVWSSCSSCGTYIPADMSRYLRLSPAVGSLESHVDDIAPEHREMIAARLELEERAHRGGANAAERQRLLEEPFLLLAPLVRGRVYRVGRIVVWVFALFASVIVVSEVSVAVSPTRPIHPVVSVASLVLCFTIIVVLGLAALRQIAAISRAGVLAAVGRSLQSLHPEPAELRDTVVRLRRQGVESCRQIRIERIVSMLQQGGAEDEVKRSLAPQSV
jgi:hypothetical protein